MPFIVKLLISIAIIIACTQIGRKLPTLAGLIATMPLTGLIVLLWLFHDHKDNAGLRHIVVGYTKGALWGILPTILFFLTLYLCFKKDLSLSLALLAGFGVWLMGAVVHQWLIR